MKNWQFFVIMMNLSLILYVIVPSPFDILWMFVTLIWLLLLILAGLKTDE